MAASNGKIAVADPNFDADVGALLVSRICGFAQTARVLTHDRKHAHDSCVQLASRWLAQGNFRRVESAV